MRFSGTEMKSGELTRKRAGGGGDILRQGYVMCKGPGVVGLCREVEELTRPLGDL